MTQPSAADKSVPSASENAASPAADRSGPHAAGMGGPRLVIVEDDAAIAELVAFNLAGEGYDAHRFGDGIRMLAALPRLMPVDLFVLDVMLPGIDGFEILRRLKTDPATEAIPVIMLTARGTESDKVRGLTSGADDYIAKPFGIREFLARVAAVLRRAGRTAADARHAAGTQPEADPARQPGPDSVIRIGPVCLDDARHRVFRDDREIDMTHREYELLKHLMQHRGIALSREELLNAVWGYDYYGETRTVDVHIRQLRRKLETDDANPMLIETVRGRGYRFTDQPVGPDRPSGADRSAGPSVQPEL